MIERTIMNFELKDGEPDKMRCASYLRFASDMAGQVALEDQKQHCRKFAGEHGWIVPDEYVYTDVGKSGTSPAGRDGLNSLIIAAKKQPSPFRMVLVEETSPARTQSQGRARYCECARASRCSRLLHQSEPRLTQ
jgi:hypothetical protein